MDEKNQSTIIRRFQWSYILGLGLIGVLLSGLILLTQQRLSAQQNDAKLINLAGRQRMLSQRLAKELLLLQSGQDIKPATILELSESWNAAHGELQKQSDTPASRLLIEQLDPVVASITDSTQRFLEFGDSSELNSVLRREREFLGLMEALVGTYEREARQRVNREKALQWTTLGLLILILVLEAWFVFRPLANRFRETLRALVRARVVTEKALEESQSAAKLKGEFLANMSHEIRTPMNGILGMSELLMDSQVEGVQREYAQIIKSSAESLLTVLNDILDISKIQAGEFRLQSLEFDLTTEVEEAAYLQAAVALEKELEVLVDIETDVPVRVKGDPIRLRQVLLNLINNAVKFTKEGYVFIKVQKDGDFLKFLVTDTGPGIPTDKFDSLFRSFEQLDGSNTREHQGTGLGLAIASKLVSLMGGEIGVESELGTGSTFWFRVELPAQGPMNGSSDDALKGKRFLIVDDVDVNRRLLASWVKDWGGLSSEAKSGEAALELLADRSYDFVLLDLQMPGLDGLETAQRITPGTMRLVALPSLGEDSAGRFEKAGFHGVLHKPLRRRLLKLLLLSLLDSGNRFVSADTVTRRSTTKAVKESDAKILVVDDSELNRDVARRFLFLFGIEAEDAKSGTEALEKVKETSYDLILMDCQMPGLDGYETTRRIRLSEITTPIIALTASVMPKDRQDCLDAGMDDFLSKPLTKSSLAHVLERYLDFETETVANRGEKS